MPCRPHIWTTKSPTASLQSQYPIWNAVRHYRSGYLRKTFWQSNTRILTLPLLRLWFVNGWLESLEQSLRFSTVSRAALDTHAVQRCSLSVYSNLNNPEPFQYVSA